jgi:divalent metal cation (Fe/Co/Zn/Cd) transporter
LSDAGASLKTQQQIRDLTMTVKGVKGVHAIRTRTFGSRLHVDLHILVNPELSVREGHSISEDVEQHLLQQGPDVLDVVVHLEPYDVEEINDEE